MAIEKTFAIVAAPDVIWRALWADLGEGQEGTYTAVESSWPERLSLRVRLASVPCLLSFRIEPKPDYAEVTARLDPEGMRYRVFQVLTFGHMRRNFEMLLVTSLANLKAAVEGTE